MSAKFETPANDKQSNHSDRDDVVNLMLFSCAFDRPPVSSNNDNSTPASELGNLLKMSDWSRNQTSDNTTGSTVNKVMNSLGDMLHNPSSEGTVSGGLRSILPNVLIEGQIHPQGKGERSGSPEASKPSLLAMLKPHSNGSGTDNSSSKPSGLPQLRPHETAGSGTDNTAPKFPKFDRSPKFKFPEDKPLDGKQADEMVDRVAKWIKESIDKDGNLNLDLNTLDRLKETLQYGVNHGEKGLQEMVAKINKKLEGTGLEIKTDGKAFAHFQTCMPQLDRGDYLGDFIGFDIMKNGKRVDSNLVKVGPGDFDRYR